MREDILAIYEPTYREMRAALELHARGVKLPESAAGLVARPGPSRQSSPAGGGMIAVLPLIGFMSHRLGGMFAMIFGGTSTAALSAEVRRAAADPSVSALVILTDSPGGEVTGTEELAQAIADAAKVKRVTAVVDGLGASAAYWAISGASEIIASPSAMLGSLGVMALHDDRSKALATEGITRTIVTSAKYKAEGAPSEPLGAEARAELQRRVDAFDTMMSKRIAAGRGVTVARVRTEFGQGRVVLAAEAVRRGMADRIGTVTDALEGLARRPPRMQAAARGRLVAGPDLETLRLRHRAADLLEVRRRRPVASISDFELLRLRARAAELS